MERLGRVKLDVMVVQETLINDYGVMDCMMESECVGGDERSGVM